MAIISKLYDELLIFNNGVSYMQINRGDILQTCSRVNWNIHSGHTFCSHPEHLAAHLPKQQWEQYLSVIQGLCVLFVLCEIRNGSCSIGIILGQNSWRNEIKLDVLFLNPLADVAYWGKTHVRRWPNEGIKVRIGEACRWILEKAELRLIYGKFGLSVERDGLSLCCYVHSRKGINSNRKTLSGHRRTSQMWDPPKDVIRNSVMI